MIDLRIKNYEAIALHDLLNSVSLLASTELANDIRIELLQGYAKNPELRSLAENVRVALDNEMVMQRSRVGMAEVHHERTS